MDIFVIFIIAIVCTIGIYAIASSSQEDIHSNLTCTIFASDNTYIVPSEDINSNDHVIKFKYQGIVYKSNSYTFSCK